LGGKGRKGMKTHDKKNPPGISVKGRGSERIYTRGGGDMRWLAFGQVAAVFTVVGLKMRPKWAGRDVGWGKQKNPDCLIEE